MIIATSVIALVVVVVFLAVLAYFVNRTDKISPGWKWLINAVLIVTAVILVLVAFGVWDEIRGVQVPRL